MVRAEQLDLRRCKLAGALTSSLLGLDLCYGPSTVPSTVERDFLRGASLSCAEEASLSRDPLLKLKLDSNPNALCVVRGAVERLAGAAGFAAAPERRVLQS